MKCLVDNNLPPALARALDALSASKFPDLEQVIALREKFSPGWWPHIVDQAERLQGGAAFRVPWKLSGGKPKFEQISF